MVPRSYSNNIITLILTEYIDYSLPLLTSLDFTSLDFASLDLASVASVDLASVASVDLASAMTHYMLLFFLFHFDQNNRRKLLRKTNHIIHEVKPQLPIYSTTAAVLNQSLIETQRFNQAILGFGKNSLKHRHNVKCIVK